MPRCIQRILFKIIGLYSPLDIKVFIAFGIDLLM
jgi:hypothetical protein